MHFLKDKRGHGERMFLLFPTVESLRASTCVGLVISGLSAIAVSCSGFGNSQLLTILLLLFAPLTLCRYLKL